MRRHLQIVYCTLLILPFVSCEEGGEPFPFKPNEPYLWNMETLSSEERMNGRVAMVTYETFTDYKGKIEQSVSCYDSAGRCLDVYFRDLDACMHIHFDYDTLGRRIEECSYLDTAGVSYDSLTARYTRTTYRYSQNGRRCRAVIESPEAKKYRFRMRFDAEGRMVRYTFPDGACCTYQYDTAGNLICYTSPDGSQERYKYNAEGELVQTQFANGMLEWYAPSPEVQYDDKGRCVQRVVGEGPTIAYYQYDDHDNWVRRTTVASQTGITTLVVRSIVYY